MNPETGDSVTGILDIPPLFRESGGGGLQRDPEGPEEERGRRVVPAYQSTGIFRAPPAKPAAHKPTRVRAPGAEMGDGIGLEPREPGVASPFSLEAPENTIGHSSQSASGYRPELLDRLRDGRICGDTIHVEELVGTQSEEVQGRRGETGQPLGEVEIEQIVQIPGAKGAGHLAKGQVQTPAAAHSSKDRSRCDSALRQASHGFLPLSIP